MHNSSNRAGSESGAWRTRAERDTVQLEQDMVVNEESHVYFRRDMCRETPCNESGPVGTPQDTTVQLVSVESRMT